MIKKPMLASALSLEDKDETSLLRFPMFASLKLDGIRAITRDGKLLSRTLKEIPNEAIQDKCSSLPNGLDGEIIIEGKSFSDITSIVMSIKEKEIHGFKFYIFDYVKESPNKPYSERLQDLLELKSKGQLPEDTCIILDQHVMSSIEDIRLFESKAADEGHEGIMLRRADSPYKYGRSTLKESYLLKVKRFDYSEAVILDIEELMNNFNPPELDLLGNTKRSSSKSGLVPANTMGALVVKDIKSGVVFRIGSGFDKEMRDEIWGNKQTYIGKTLRYHFQSVGVKSSPRIPVFSGFRDERDMGDS